MPKSVSIPISFDIPFGKEYQHSFYVNNGTTEVEYTDNLFKAHIIKRQNQIWTIEGEMIDINASDTHIIDGSEFKLFVGKDILFLKGRFEEVKYDSNYGCKFFGKGMVGKMQEEIQGRTSYSNENTNTIISDLVSDHLNVGINDNYGRVNMNFENINNLESSAKLVDEIDYYWYESWGNNPFNTDYFNVSSTPGSLSSVYTFDISGSNANCIINTRDKDKENFANYIKLNGQGDGVAQLYSEWLHATTNRTTMTYSETKLNGDLSNSATTITVIDTTAYPSSGTIQIDNEKITYTGKTSTTFTGCTRGTGGTIAVIHDDAIDVINLTTLTVGDTSSFPASPTTFDVWIGIEKLEVVVASSTTLTVNSRGEDSTKIYAHEKDIEVYDATYTKTSPQSESSVDDNGLKEKTLEDMSIIDQNALDRACQKIGNKIKYPIERIILETIDPIVVLQYIDIGDIITINDANAGLSSDEKRIVGLELDIYGLSYKLKIEVSNSRLNFQNVYKSAEDEIKYISIYGQGGPSKYVVNKEQNCDSSNGIKLRFFAPPNVTAFNELKINYDIGKYRVDSTITQSGGGITTVQSTGEIHNWCISTNETAGTLLYLKVPNSSKWSVPESSVTTWEWWLKVTNRDAVNVLTGTGFTVYDFTSGNNVIYNEGGAISVPPMTSEYYTSSLFTDRRGKALYAYIVNPSGTSDYQLELIVIRRVEHTHIAPSHTHNLSYGISEDLGTYSVTDVTIKIDGTDKTTDYETENGTLAYAEDSTEDNGILKKEWFTEPFSNRWHTIELNPNNNCRIDASLYIDLFAKSSKTFE